MSIYTDALLYGKKEERLIVLQALGVPDSLATLDDDAKTKPHLAIVDDIMWIWSVEAQEWIALETGGGGSDITGGKQIYVATEGQTAFVTLDSIPLTPENVLVFRNGLLIAFTIVDANNFTISACDLSDDVVIKWVNGTSAEKESFTAITDQVLFTTAAAMTTNTDRILVFRNGALVNFTFVNVNNLTISPCDAGDNVVISWIN